MLHCFRFIAMTKPFHGSRMQVAVNIEVPTLQLALMKRNMEQGEILHLDDARYLTEILEIVLRVVPVIVLRDQGLLSVQATSDLEPALAEAEIAQMPHDVFLSDRRIPPA